jgi:lipopolysaccharide/colanic/teichoic acid biosynthesis glycosyltransferase
MSAELALGLEPHAATPGRSLRLAPSAAGPYQRRVKPLFDRVLVLVLAIAVIPVATLVACVVLVGLGRPVMFRQDRVGQDGRVFTVYKFRSMRYDRRQRPDDGWDALDRRRTHKSDDDPRHTGVGRFLRRTSLDELPQLWNVLTGDMSLVGPRPELVSVVARYEPWQHRRHQVKPGLTGLWQISARGDRPMHEATHIDLEYIATLGVRTDLDILFRTPTAVLRKRGA